MPGFVLREILAQPGCLDLWRRCIDVYSDWPGDMYDTIIQNKLTGKPNYLTELHVGLDFITALALKTPGDSLQVLGWAGWDVGWDYTFDTPTSGQSGVLKGSITRS